MYVTIWFQTASICIPCFNVTENIRKGLDERNIGCGVFVNLQKPFDTVDQILLAKLNNYGICGVSSYYSKSYLPNRNQFTFINGYDSGLVAINCGIPQGSVLRSLPFLLLNKRPYQALKFCIVHHFFGSCYYHVTYAFQSESTL